MPSVIPPPHSDVIPAPDADFALFLTQFAGAWVPATFNTVLPTASSLGLANTAFSSALLLATDPTTRTGVTIASKVLERVIATLLLRSAIRAAQAAYLAGIVTEAQINNLGIRGNELIRTPIGVPVYGPILGVDGVFAGLTRMRLTQVDQATGLAVTTRGFVYGIVGVQVERSVVAAPFALRFAVRRVKFFDSTSLVASGSVLSYRARYVTARGLVSPFSPVVSCVSQ